MPLNERQQKEALLKLHADAVASGVDPKGLAESLNNLSDADYNEKLEVKFLEAKESQGVQTNALTAAIGGIADTVTFGHAANVASVFGDDFAHQVEDKQEINRISNPAHGYDIGRVAGYVGGLAGQLLKVGTKVGAKVVAQTALQQTAGETGKQMIKRVAAEGAIGGALTGGAEAVLREDTSVAGGTIGGAVGGAAGSAVVAGVPIAASKIKGKTLEAMSKIANRGKQVSPEFAELITNMEDVVKFSKDGLRKKGKELSASFEEVGQKFAGILQGAKQQLELSPEEVAFKSGKEMKQGLSALIDDAALALSESAQSKNAIHREELAAIGANLSEAASNARQILSHNYGDVVKPLMDKGKHLKISLKEPIQGIIDALPEGAIVGTEVNKTMLGPKAAKQLENLMTFSDGVHSLEAANEFKKALGGAASWGDTSRMSAEVKQYNTAIQGAYESTKLTMLDAFKQVDPSVDLTKVFNDYHTGLKVAGRFEDTFATAPTDVTKRLLRDMEELNNSFNSAKYVKPMSAESQKLIANGIGHVKKILDTSSILDATKARSAIKRAINAPDAEVQKSALESITGEFARRRDIDDQLEKLGIHDKLIKAIKFPNDKPTQEAADELLGKLGKPARAVFESVRNKAAKLQRLEGLPKNAREFINAVKNEGSVNPNVTHELADVVTLVPEIDKLLVDMKLEKLSRSPLIREMNLDRDVLLNNLGMTGAGGLAYWAMPEKYRRKAAPVIGGLLVLNAILKQPARLAYLDKEFKLFGSREALESAVLKLDRYNKFIFPALKQAATPVVEEILPTDQAPTNQPVK
jgi:hypothetical protein